MHSIRLGRPWRKCVLGSDAPMRIDVPEMDAAESPQEGLTFCYRRSFNRPTGLGPSSRVYLRIEGWEGRLESVAVNGFVMKFPDSARIETEITNLLAPHNEIEFQLTGQSGQAARLSGEVALAIDDTDQSSSVTRPYVQ